MSDLNQYAFTGRLGKDAELKFTQGGTAIWTASVGVGYGYGDNKGTNWLRVQVFGKRAESLGNLNLAKGTAIAGAGELRLREYDNRDGGKSWAHEVNANDIHLLGGKPEGSAGHGGGKGGAPNRERPARATDAARDEFEDSIPFATNRSAW